MRPLGEIELSGENIGIFVPAALSSDDPDFFFEFSVTPEALVKLKSLEVSYGGRENRPELEKWIKVPTGIYQGSFVVSPEYRDGKYFLWIQDASGETTSIMVGK